MKTLTQRIKPVYSEILKKSESEYGVLVRDLKKKMDTTHSFMRLTIADAQALTMILNRELSVSSLSEIFDNE